MSTSIIGQTAKKVEPGLQPPAALLGPAERKDLALKTLARTEPVKTLAARHGVSRKFLYAQAEKADRALEEAFASGSEKPEDKVLFYIPVTKQWLRQVVLALCLICRSSVRGVCEFFRDILDIHIGVGTVHNIVSQASERARALSEQEDLSTVHAAAHDEIFQAGKPILVGADPQSTYCYLMGLEEHRDADTWAVHLMDLSERGLRPDYTIGDGAKGMRAGQAEAWPGVPFRADTFHPLREAGRLSFYLNNRAKGARTAREKLDRKMERAKNRGEGQKFSKRLAVAREVEGRAVQLAEDVEVLLEWLQNDILALVGPEAPIRVELFDFVTAELKEREPLAPHRIGPVRRGLENQRDELLAFVRALDVQLEEIAQGFHVPPEAVRAVYELQGLADEEPRKWQKEAEIRGELRDQYYAVQAAVRQVLAETVRASSIIENLNSRLRPYVFLWKTPTQRCLDLLQFFLNHRTFLRSERPEREGKSPAELLTGQAHPHWLELLGFELFHRAA